MKLVILDRDGVINEDSRDYIKSPAEWRPLPGSLDAIAQLTAAGYTVAVATNQSGIARGLLDAPTLAAIHERMRAAISAAGGRIDAIHYCPHGPADACECRKPKPGLLQEIGARFNTSLQGVPVIGDAERDLQAARAVGARPILVLTGKGRATHAHLSAQETPEVHADLATAARALIGESTAGCAT
jgi:D-glycero-D-manno-heptose 1,7-bisphosphate phosphatase